jgi:hypothetical protein
MNTVFYFSPDGVVYETHAYSKPISPNSFTTVGLKV